MQNPYHKEQRGGWQLLKRTVLGCGVVLLVLGCETCEEYPLEI